MCPMLCCQPIIPQIPQLTPNTCLLWRCLRRLQALDVVLKHRASYNKDCLPVGRAFFFHDQNVRRAWGWRLAGGDHCLGLPVAGASWLCSRLAVLKCDPQHTCLQVRSIGGGAEVWLGYQQSLRPCQVGGLDCWFAGLLTPWCHQAAGQFVAQSSQADCA